MIINPRSIRRAVLSCLGFFLLAGSVVRAEFDEGQLFACSSMSKTITVRRSDLSERTFRVADGCRISARGKNGTLADLKIGDHVVIGYPYYDPLLWSRRQARGFPIVDSISTSVSDDAKLVGVKDPNGPATPPQAGAGQAAGAAGSPISKAMDRVVIPTVAFNDAKLPECVTFVRDACAKSNKGAPPNIVIRGQHGDPSGSQVKITLSLNSVSALRVLDEVCSQADYQLKEDRGIIVLSPK